MGKLNAEQQLKVALTSKSQYNVIDNNTAIIKDCVMAISVAEPVLFGICGRKSIIRQRPFEVYLIEHYWVINGTLSGKNLRGTFLLILDSRNGKIIRVTHGK